MVVQALKKLPSHGLLSALAVGLAFSITLTAQAPKSDTEGAVNAEAQKQARQYWDQLLTKCGDSYYLVVRGRLTEFKDIVFRTNPQTLLRADRMNGFQWRGSAEMRSEVHRIQDDKGAWGPWYDGPGDDIIFLIEKKAGEWSVDVTHMYTEQARNKPACPSIPGTVK